MYGIVALGLYSFALHKDTVVMIQFVLHWTICAFLLSGPSRSVVIMIFGLLENCFLIEHCVISVRMCSNSTP